ncbi:hypothetical protein JR316_0010544 [Psilocybe cubensis]|uniref:Uncharacterized protein n=2 Tax=Psilocybe cubensis TaxID=181762 RepID=A0ACB8GLT5_PSICU|nr:hypothetical protein JR316_0010544 [Psilocybe cubensis]KAH9476631.1 hypothetical protein JR316_0010544 [Psilocybe cubensis]
MESLNLNTLANSLPTTQQNAEKELLNDFKAAALSITTLYRSSRKNSKRAYNAGYAAACQDLLTFIQQGVSADVGHSPASSSHAVVEGGGMTIGRVMDWTEARVDAIKAREEEEDEDEDRERVAVAAPAVPATRTAPPPVPTKSEGKKPGHPSSSSTASASSSRVKENMTSLPTPNSPASHSSTQPPSEPSSPSPPPSATLPRSSTRSSRSRGTPTKESFRQSTTLPVHFPSTHPHSHSHSHLSHLSDPSTTPSSVSTIQYPETPIVNVIGAGAKRRHAVMRMLDANTNPPTTTISIGGPSSTVSSPGGMMMGGNNNAYTGSTASSLSRRRTRSSRNLTQLQPHNPNISVIQMNPEAMDVEEDGRDRKRVARR